MISYDDRYEDFHRWEWDTRGHGSVFTPDWWMMGLIVAAMLLAAYVVGIRVEQRAREARRERELQRELEPERQRERERLAELHRQSERERQRDLSLDPRASSCLLAP